jgi:hypothetical protein
MNPSRHLSTEGLPMKFSIRDLLMVIVALALACPVVHNVNIYAEKNARALEEVL